MSWYGEGPVEKTLKKQPKDDQDFLHRAHEDYTAANSAKTDLVDDWERYDNYIEDDQWATPSKRDEWKPRPVTNICWEKLQTIHGNTSSAEISCVLTERTPGYAAEASLMSDILNYYWDALDMKRKLSEAEWIRPKLGTVVFKTPWNPEKNDGYGDLDCFVVHPANFFPDPNVINPWEIQQAEFIEFVSRKSKRWICNHFAKENDEQCKYSKAQLKQMIISDTTSETDIYGTEVFPGQRELVDLHEYWYKDDNDNLQVAWYAGWVLLKKSEDDSDFKKEGFYRHGRYPVVVIPYVEKDKRFWGRSELQSLVGESSRRDGIQDIINKFDQAFILSMLMHGLGQKAYQHGKIKNPEKTLTGEPDLIIPTKGDPREALYHIQGPGPNPQVMAYREAKLIDADRITKQWDITQGRASPAIKTATQTLALKEEAMKGMGDRIQTLRYGLKEIFELWIEHLIEHVTTEREWCIKKGKELVPVKFNPSRLAQMKPRELGEEGEWTETPGESRRIYFNIKVSIGNTVAISEAFLFQMGLDLFAAGLIDVQGCYDMMPDWPGKSETLERMLQQIKAAQEAERQEVVPGLSEFVQNLPPEAVEQISQLPKEQQVAAVMDLFAEGGETA